MDLSTSIVPERPTLRTTLPSVVVGCLGMATILLPPHDDTTWTSVLAYLQRLPIDYVKIDGELVRQSHRCHTSRVLLHAVVEMAHGLGAQTVAEYVEDAAVLDVCRSERVDLAQGHLVGHPVPWPSLVDQHLGRRRSADLLRGT